MDEDPTYGYFPSVYYYQGQVREKQNMAGFADSYGKYPRYSSRVKRRSTPRRGPSQNRRLSTLGVDSAGRDSSLVRSMELQQRWRPHRDSNPGFSLERAAS